MLERPGGTAQARAKFNSLYKNCQRSKWLIASDAVPVCCGRDGYSFGANTHGEDLGRICPGDWSHGDSKTTHKEVGANDDALRNGVMIVDNPNT